MAINSLTGALMGNIGIEWLDAVDEDSMLSMNYFQKLYVLNQLEYLKLGSGLLSIDQLNKIDSLLDSVYDRDSKPHAIYRIVSPYKYFADIFVYTLGYSTKAIPIVVLDSEDLPYSIELIRKGDHRALDVVIPFIKYDLPESAYGELVEPAESIADQTHSNIEKAVKKTYNQSKIETHRNILRHNFHLLEWISRDYEEGGAYVSNRAF